MRRRHPSLTIFLLAAALLVRGLMPVGWMPAASAASIIMPCPADWPALRDAGHDHRGDAHHGKHAHADGECAFAPLLSAADVQAHVALPAAPSPQTAVRALAFCSAAQPRGPPSLPPPATGPPALT